MKRSTNFLIAALIVALALTGIAGCKKYEEGPSLSLRSRTARVANTWKMEKVMYNSTDITGSLTSINYTETYDKDGNYSYSSNSSSGSGQWSFQNDDTEIKRNGVSSQSTETLKILKLKEKSFWYSYTDGNDVYEFHFIPNE